MVTVDLSVPGQAKYAVEQTTKHYGSLDILINNAGQAAIGAIEEVDLAHMRQIMELNVYAPLEAMQAAIPIMLVQGGGEIINISSMVSKMKIPNLGAYAATKAALNMISDTARVELANDGIRLLSVFPRMTATDFAMHSLGNTTYHSQQHANSAYPVDSPEFVAERILHAAVSEQYEQFMDR